jgi:hypothetical protein
MLALEEMDWLGLLGPLVGRIGDANVYLSSSHDLLKVAWHYHRVAIPLALSALRATSVLSLPAGGALRAPVRAPARERPPAQVRPRLAPGGPSPDVIRTGAVIGSRP